MDWAPTTSTTRSSASTQQPAPTAGRTAAAAVAGGADNERIPSSGGASDAAEAGSGSSSHPTVDVAGPGGDHSLAGHAYTGHSDRPAMYSPHFARTPLPQQVASDFTTAAGRQIFVSAHTNDVQTQDTQLDASVHTSHSLVSLCVLRCMKFISVRIMYGINMHMSRPFRPTRITLGTRWAY